MVSRRSSFCSDFISKNDTNFGQGAQFKLDLFISSFIMLQIAFCLKFRPGNFIRLNILFSSFDKDIGSATALSHYFNDPMY